MFDPEKICPLIGDACIKSKCQWFIHLQGRDPNTGKPTDEPGCAVAWLPVLLIENAQKVNQASGEVSGLRKDVREGQQATAKILAHEMRNKIGSLT